MAIKKNALRKHDIGRRLTVDFPVIGNVDAMLIEIRESGDYNVYVFPTSNTDIVDADQIEDVGDFIEPRATG